MMVKSICRRMAALMLSAAVIAAGSAAALARTDLAIPDVVIGNDTIWGWVSDGTDDVASGIEVTQFQNAKYLVFEIGELPTEDTWYGLAWLSSNGWSWKENDTKKDNHFSLKDCLIGDSILCFELSQILPDYNDFRLDEADYMKVYFRYGDEKDPDNNIFPSDLKITAVYLSDERPSEPPSADGDGGEPDAGDGSAGNGEAEPGGNEGGESGDGDSGDGNSGAGNESGSPAAPEDGDDGPNWVVTIVVSILGLAFLVAVILVAVKMQKK